MPKYYYVFCFQTISNGTSVKDKDGLKKDIIDTVTDRDSNKEPNKENTNINIDQKNSVITDSNANRVKENKAKRKDTSKQIASSVIKNANIPKFHFPLGRPGNKDDAEEVLLRVSQEFSKVEGGKVYKHQMQPIVKVILTLFNPVIVPANDILALIRGGGGWG